MHEVGWALTNPPALEAPTHRGGEGTKRIALLAGPLALINPSVTLGVLHAARGRESTARGRPRRLWRSVALCTFQGWNIPRGRHRGRH